MEQRITNIEKHVGNIDRNITELTTNISVLTVHLNEFALFVKQKFEHHDQLFDTISTTVFRLEKGQMRVEAMLQHLYFRDFEDS